MKFHYCADTDSLYIDLAERRSGDLGDAPMPRTIRLTEAQKDLVLHDNVAELYGLTV